MDDLIPLMDLIFALMECFASIMNIIDMNGICVSIVSVVVISLSIERGYLDDKERVWGYLKYMSYMTYY